MLINNWYVAAESAAVIADRPIGVRMLGLDFVLYRDSAGQVICLSNVCCHRGGALSDGRINSGCIACPYHGWEYNSSGRCVKIPALGDDARIPKRARIDSYPTEEKYGWVWAFLGDLPEEDRPVIPDLFPEYHDSENWRLVPYHIEANVNWVRFEENSLDTIHTAFVHKHFGGRVDPTSAAAPIERLPLGARVSRTKYAPDDAAKVGAVAELLAEDRKRTQVSLEFSFVGVCHRIQPTFKEGMSQIQFSVKTPIDPYRTRVFGWQARNFLLEPKYDEERQEGIAEALQEDLRVVEKVKPPLTPPILPDEFLTPADTMELEFRKIYQDFCNRGWLIDSDRLERESRTRVLVIPSPARRQDPKSWVQQLVPLIPGSAAQAAGHSQTPSIGGK